MTKSKNKVKVKWPNGEISTAKDWPMFFIELKNDQWKRFLTMLGLKVELKRRAAIWSGNEVSSRALFKSARDFAYVLARRYMFKILKG